MASGDTLITFYPLGNEPTATDYATLDLRNSHPVLDFDGSTSERAVWSAVMPQHYAGTTGVTSHLHFSMSSDTTNLVDWNLQFERIGDQVLDVDADSFATGQQATGSAVPGTSGAVDDLSVAFTDGAQMDSVVAGDLFRLMCTRTATDDTSTTDAELHAVEIRET